MDPKAKTMDKIVALCKGRGFVFPGSEIYGGLANTWDYGPLGVEFKNNVKKAWWRKFVTESRYNVGLDCAILMNPETWVASGHVGGFNDPLMDCKSCHERFRADKLIEEYAFERGEEIDVAVMSNEEMEAFIAEHIPCPSCGAKANFTSIRKLRHSRESMRIRLLRFICARKRLRVFLSTSKMCCALPEERCRWELHRLVNLSAMRLRPVTLLSVPENLNRWNWNFSAIRQKKCSGSITGKIIAQNS